MERKKRKKKKKKKKEEDEKGVERLQLTKTSIESEADRVSTFFPMGFQPLNRLGA